MDLLHNGPAWACYTMGLHGPATQWACHTMGLLHNGPATQWACYTMGLPHNGPATQWVCYTIGLSCTKGPATQWDRYTMGLLHNGTGTRRDWEKTGQHSWIFIFITVSVLSYLIFFLLGICVVINNKHFAQSNSSDHLQVREGTDYDRGLYINI